MRIFVANISFATTEEELSIGKSKGLFHRRRVLPCRPPCATGSHLPAVLPSARRPLRAPRRRRRGAGADRAPARLVQTSGTGCCKGAEGCETDSNT